MKENQVLDSANSHLDVEIPKNSEKIGSRTFKLDHENLHQGIPKLVILDDDKDKSKENALYVAKYFKQHYMYVDNTDRIMPFSKNFGYHYICGFDFEIATCERMCKYTNSRTKAAT